jgi:hypothetical protein
MRTNFTWFLIRCVATTVAWAGAMSLQAASDSLTAVEIFKRASQSPQFSPAVEEVAKLSKAGVSDTVTLAYVRNSGMTYSLDAQDVLWLQGQGVSPQVVTAMLQQGGEVRRATEAIKQAQAIANASKPQPATTTATTPTTVVETAPASTVSVTYFGSRPYSYYPSYAYNGPGFGYYYPAYYAPRYYGYCGPRVGFGVGFGYPYRGYARCW